MNIKKFVPKKIKKIRAKIKKNKRKQKTTNTKKNM